MNDGLKARYLSPGHVLADYGRVAEVRHLRKGEVCPKHGYAHEQYPGRPSPCVCVTVSNGRAELGSPVFRPDEYVDVP